MGAMRQLSAKLLIPQEERHLLNSDGSKRRDNLSRRVAWVVGLTKIAVTGFPHLRIFVCRAPFQAGSRRFRASGPV
jgi:hypothetical protein